MERSDVASTELMYGSNNNKGFLRYALNDG